MPQTSSNTAGKDVFAGIAANRRAVSDRSLIAPPPAPLPERILPLNAFDPEQTYAPQSKMETPDQLRAELLRQRDKYAPFLRDCAPPLPKARLITPVPEFDWRLQTEADRADFSMVWRGAGDWKRVAIPHYGGPLGRATAYYRASVNIGEEMASHRALFLCFDGVDYKAHVFLNGTFLGSHEGFFAPFEFDCTAAAAPGENTLVVVVENDAICLGNGSWGKDGHLYEGDKIYAATGPGYDEPEVGWHHCPPGMGIYQAVRLEARSLINIRDLFVRPLSLNGDVEVWIEVWNCHRTRRDVALALSVYGRNFEATVVDNLPVGQKELGPGVNYLRIPLTIAAPRIWEPESPWLYQLQARVLDGDGRTTDAAGRQFGLRTFRMEEVDEPKGRFFLNDRQIRLRGANTMGFEQQDVIHGDWNQLVDDILLAKICRMNFWRLTQRPVQPEIYDYCDRLGLMTQTDLPLFGVLRRNQFCEAVRQAEEMERLVRAHPCNIMVSYINESLPGAHGKPHRHLLRNELERFFLAADQAVRLANPDRVIKAVDGDYDPPAPGFPDNHCYCGWYNGHGVELGKLHKGWWQPVKPGWNYGCGEFGAEGLDAEEIMRTYYPPAWLPQTKPEENTWTPDGIPRAQTGHFHYLWFETQHTLADWARESRRHQAWVTKLMTEAFRRDARMTSFAIHLFIDAFPSGWMKAIMDVDRNPKPAFFAYREALAPLMANLRSDRLAFFAGEEIVLEAWVCNDESVAGNNRLLRYSVEIGGKHVLSGESAAMVPVCSSQCQGILRFKAPTVGERTECTVKLGLLDNLGVVLHDTSCSLEVFPVQAATPCARDIVVIGEKGGKAAALVEELGLQARFSEAIQPGDVVLVDDMNAAAKIMASLETKAKLGATIVFLNVPPGRHPIGGNAITVRKAGMNPSFFAAGNTGHPLVAGFKPADFRFWYDKSCDYVTPLLASTFIADDPDWAPILTSGNKDGDWMSEWRKEYAAAEKKIGAGSMRICQIELVGRVSCNPVARIFATRLIGC